MRAKFFLIITICITFSFTFFTEVRELSIQQLEERKKADEERKKQREKRGEKKFQKEIILTTDIVFVSKERELPPVLSNLDPILEDEGFYGVKLAIEDNLTTGRFLGHDYKVEFHRILLEENLETEFGKLLQKGKKFFVVDLNEEELLSLMKIPEIDDVLIFNIRAKNDSLRNENCRKNFFHIPPSYSILSDALTQYLVKKNGKNGFWLLGLIKMIRFILMHLKVLQRNLTLTSKKKKFGTLQQI